MGYPVITRLGYNQLWYRKWYNDDRYNNYIKLLNTFNKVITSYLKYGLLFNNNIFIHTYWYRKKRNIYTKTNYNHNLYFRRYYYAHKILTIDHSYLLRISTPEYFPLRTYIIKYNNWIFISIQWFKPLKPENTKNMKLLQVGNNKFTKNSIKTTLTNYSKKNLTTRLKVVILHILIIFSRGYRYNYNF